ncbi:Pole-organizing protein PopZ [Novosphingobium lubricantis]
MVGVAGSMQQNGEPSVEEILESIKKVIARDNRAEAAQARARRDIAERPADVLELTEAADADDGLPDSADSGLVAGATAASMRESLAALSMLAQPGAAPQIVRSGETSLEGLVREMLKPMLAEWLERNLPAMVEKMVSAEIARIAGKRG